MRPNVLIATSLSSVAFLWYGAGVLRSRSMVAEFERYHLAPYRTVTGLLQMAAAVGLVIGLAFRPLLLLSAGGLAAMMLGAVIVRVRAGDPLLTGVPALLLLCLNVYIMVADA